LGGDRAARDAIYPGKAGRTDNEYAGWLRSRTCGHWLSKLVFDSEVHKDAGRRTGSAVVQAKSSLECLPFKSDLLKKLELDNRTEAPKIYVASQLLRRRNAATT
jgi:hypothetical protein